MEVQVVKLQEGQPIDETLEGRAGAYAAFCPCSVHAAKIIVGQGTYHADRAYNMMVKRQTNQLVEDIETYLGAEK